MRSLPVLLERHWRSFASHNPQQVPAPAPCTPRTARDRSSIARTQGPSASTRRAPSSTPQARNISTFLRLEGQSGRSQERAHEPVGAATFSSSPSALPSRHPSTHRKGGCDIAHETLRSNCHIPPGLTAGRAKVSHRYLTLLGHLLCRPQWLALNATRTLLAQSCVVVHGGCWREDWQDQFRGLTSARQVGAVDCVECHTIASKSCS
jgi:hypothetical protein